MIPFADQPRRKDHNAHQQSEHKTGVEEETLREEILLPQPLDGRVSGGLFLDPLAQHGHASKTIGKLTAIVVQEEKLVNRHKGSKGYVQPATKVSDVALVRGVASGKGEERRDQAQEAEPVLEDPASGDLAKAVLVQDCDSPEATRTEGILRGRCPRDPGFSTHDI